MKNGGNTTRAEGNILLNEQGYGGETIPLLDLKLFFSASKRWIGKIEWKFKMLGKEKKGNCVVFETKPIMTKSTVFVG